MMKQLLKFQTAFKVMQDNTIINRLMQLGAASSAEDHSYKFENPYFVFHHVENVSERPAYVFHKDLHRISHSQKYP